MATRIQVSDAWLGRFEELMDAAFRECFDGEWTTEINAAESVVCATRGRDGARVCVDLHPGMSVVIPLYAAQRVARRLHEEAVKAGYCDPLPPID